MIQRKETCGFDDVKKIKGKYVCTKCNKKMDSGWIYGLSAKQKQDVDNRK